MAKERWSDRGEMSEFESEKAPASESSRPWKPEEISQLRARVPFHPSGWNTCAEMLNDWKFCLPWAALFIFALSLLSPQMRGVLGLELYAATTLSMILVLVWSIPPFVLVAAEKNKSRPSVWRNVSFGDFYKQRGTIAAMPELQQALVKLPKNLPLGELLTLAALEIEYCDQAPVVIVWRLVFSHVTIGVTPTAVSQLEFAYRTPILVFDTKSKRVLDPSEI